MANYFVKTDGNDGNDGSTWALAKATVQAGLGLCTSAGDVLNVAPGRYNETSLSPSAAGTSGSPMQLFGDVLETVSDGSAATHGKGIGFVILDGSSTQGSNSNTGTYTRNFVYSDNWNYWKVSNLYVCGCDRGLILAPATPGTAGRVEVYNCVATSGGLEPIDVALWQPVSSSYPVILDRVVLLGGRGASPLTGLLGYRSGAFPATPDFVISNSVFWDYGTPMQLAGGSASYYTYASFTNCTFIAEYYSASWGGAAAGTALNGANATYNKYDAVRCAARAPNWDTGLTRGTLTENKMYGYSYSSALPTGVTFLTLDPWHLMPGPRQFLDSLLISASTDSTARTGVYGETGPNGTYNDIGAQEFFAKRFPKPPTGYVIAYDAAGDTVINISGGVSRSRFVNLGG